MTAPQQLPESCELDRLARDWSTAAAARIANNVDGVLDAILPAELPAVETFLRMRGFLLLGATGCAQEIRRHHGPTQGGVFGFTILDADTDAVVDTQDPDAGDAAAVGRLLSTAANGDTDTLEAVVSALIPVTGDARDSRHVFSLLDVYCTLVTAGAR